MTEQFVRYAVDGRMARVTLARPENDNRIGIVMMRQVIDALESAHRDAADILVVDAEGADFTVGRDQTEKVEGISKRQSLSLILDANHLLSTFPGVSVVGFQGRARGFGAGMIVQSDIAIAGASASVAFDEIRHGFAPTIVLTYLADTIGRKRALDLVTTARVLDGAQACDFGIVSRVAPTTSPAAMVDEVVAEMLDCAPHALAMCKSFSVAMRTSPPAERGERALDALTMGAH